MSENANDRTTSVSACGSDVDCRCPSIDGDSTSELAAKILTARIMLLAYAAAVVIFALGLVALVITIGVLCFFYPSKANAFLVLVGTPLGMLLVHYAKQIPVLKLICKEQDK